MPQMNKWDKRFMQLTEMVATWSSCYQENRHVGAIIVKDKRVMTTGYNGAPAGIESCEEKGECLRRKLEIPSGTKHELCFAVHAEQNALADAARRGVTTQDAIAYVTHFPCINCAKMLLAAGIKKCYYYKDYHNDELVVRLFESANVGLEQF